MVQHVLKLPIAVFMTLATFCSVSMWITLGTTLTYQTYLWARMDFWPMYSLATGFEWLGCDLTFLASPADWHGIAKVSWAVLTVTPVEIGILLLGLGAAYVCNNILWELEDKLRKWERRVQREQTPAHENDELGQAL